MIAIFERTFDDIYNTSKYKICNKNYKGLGTTAKEKKRNKRRHRWDDNTVPLSLDIRPRD